MNPTLDTLNKDDIINSCNNDGEYIDEEINDEMKNKFNEDLFRDANDFFGVKNSQRQFYSVPLRGAPDMKKFAEWLYKPSTKCKVDQNNCLPYEDLRYINIVR